jgi:hypothetical protein
MMAEYFVRQILRAQWGHPNTVRRWRLIRLWSGSNGYRLFTQRHLDCASARTVYSAPYPGRGFRAGQRIIKQAVADDWQARSKKRMSIWHWSKQTGTGRHNADILEHWAQNTTTL